MSRNQHTFALNDDEEELLQKAKDKGKKSPDDDKGYSVRYILMIGAKEVLKQK